MGVRKREKAEQMKEAKKTQYFAKLNNCPTSPRKMRLMADLVRGEKIDKALNILKFSSKEASKRLEKLLLSNVTEIVRKIWNHCSRKSINIGSKYFGITLPS